MEIPDFVIKKLEKIAERNEMSLDEVKTEYEKKYSSDFIQNDPQFEDDEMRHQYASGAFWGDYMNKPKVTPTPMIPIGVAPVGKSKSTSLPYCSLYFLNKNKKLRRCSFNGNVAFKTKDISYWSLYKDVKLKHYNDSNDFGADERADFEDPEMIDINKKSIIETLKVPIIKISEAKQNESKKDSTGYTDTLDWKCIKGYIKYESKTEYEDGDYGEWGRYTITDGGEDLGSVNSDGTINTGGFSVRISPTLMKYPVNSECYFLGTIGNYESKKTKETVWTMDCFCIIPIIVVRD